MSSFTSQRALTYWLIFFFFLLAGGPIYILDATIPLYIHSIFDGTAALLSIVATALVYAAYRQTKATALAILSITLAGAASFELLHEVADATLLEPLMTSDPDFFMPWSWHASRIFFGLGLLVAAVYAGRDNYGSPATVGQKKFPSPLVFGVVSVVTVVGGTTALLMADLPSIYYSSVGLLRLPEIISGSIIFVALILFVWRGNWRTDSYGHWLNVGIVVSVSAQFFCMAFSQAYLDSSFALAHLLKVVSYGCIVFGFARVHQISGASTEADELRPRGLGLGIKVALLCGFIGFICVMPIAYKSSQNLHEIAAQNGMKSLSAASVATSEALDEQRQRVDADLTYLARSKIIESLYSAQQGDGVDIATGKTSSELQANLSRLMQNLLFSDSDYLSLAFIDATSGQILIRSEQRQGFGVAALNRPQLEQSESELASRMGVDHHSQTPLRSNLFLLNDVGSAEQNHLQIEGAALPVYSSESQTLLGTFIVHSDVSAALTSRGLSDVATQAYVVSGDGSGRFLSHPDASKEEYVVGEDNFTLEDQFPGLDFAALTATGSTGEALYQQADGLDIILGVERSTNSNGEPLLYITTSSREDMEKTAKAIGYELQQIAQFNLLVAIFVGWFFARRFARPVQEISEAAVKFGRSGTVTDLKIKGRDEIAMLGHSLSEMMSEVAQQREKLTLLAAAVESSVDSTLITTIRGQVEYVNPHYLLYAGVTEEEVLGKNIMELREFEENRHILTEAPAKKGNEHVWMGELSTRRADGKVHHETITIAPIRNAEGKNINQSLIIEDVTERRLMELNIERKAAELQRSNRDLEQFAYVASHDLKSPLRAIEVLVSWLKDDLEGHDEGDIQENLDLLSRRTSRLSRLLDDLLAYSRAGRKIGDIRPINTCEFVDDVISVISPPEGFTIEVAEDLPNITTYHAPLETVFRNLIGNAIKHSPIPEEGRIRIYAEDQGELVEFSVEDNGTGIEPEYAEKVFKMFQTLQARDEKEGSGMGLAIVQRIIDWQGGKIWFEDGPDGKGAVFKFTWRKTPIAQPAMPAEGEDVALSQTQILREQAAAEALETRAAEFGDEDYTEHASTGSVDAEHSKQSEPTDV